jgi:opine dehydrogenase
MATQVTICGGGNGAHAAVAWIGSKSEYKVNLLTRRPQDWKKQVVVHCAGSSWESKGSITGTLNKVSANPAEVIPGSSIVIVAAPAHVHFAILKSIASHLDAGASVGSLYCQGGFDWAAQGALGMQGLSRLNCLWGLQNIPWICNLKNPANYGKQSWIIGPKQKLFVAASPPSKAASMCAPIAALFDIPCTTVPNFLSLTLAPSNQIIHPARYWAIFRDWDGKKSYSHAELAARNGLTLYADMCEAGAENMAMLDNELQQIKFGLLRRYPQLDLSLVMPMGERIIFQYGPDVKDHSSLRKIFQTNLGYAGCATPKVMVSPGLYQPATKSRLFVEDIPFGLCILKSMAQMLNIPTPRIDFFIEWHQQYMDVKYIKNGSGVIDPAVIKGTGMPEAYGITSLDQLVSNSLPRGANNELRASL